MIRPRIAGAILGWAALAWAAAAAATEVSAVGPGGAPMADVAVWATAADPNKTPRDKARVVEIGQRARVFERLVSVVETGKKISFPNHDVVRHHVYSFSEPKKFDIKLYAGGESPEVAFEQDGLVVLGCNIHDKMLAYVRVVPTSAYAVTDATGMANLDLPEGDWVIHAWHPTMGEKSEGAQEKSKGGQRAVKVSIIGK